MSSFGNITNRLIHWTACRDSPMVSCVITRAKKNFEMDKGTRLYDRRREIRGRLLNEFWKYLVDSW
jgi:hypothetical protein